MGALRNWAHYQEQVLDSPSAINACRAASDRSIDKISRQHAICVGYCDTCTPVKVYTTLVSGERDRNSAVSRKRAVFA